MIDENEQPEQPESGNGEPAGSEQPKRAALDGFSRPAAVPTIPNRIIPPNASRMPDELTRDLEIAKQSGHYMVVICHAKDAAKGEILIKRHWTPRNAEGTIGWNDDWNLRVLSHLAAMIVTAGLQQHVHATLSQSSQVPPK